MTPERERAARLQESLGIMVQASEKGYAIVDYAALAVLGRQRNEQVSELLDLERQLDIKARQLAEKDEALREALRLRNEVYVSTPVRDDTRNAHFALQALGQILREALRAEPAKEEA